MSNKKISNSHDSLLLRGHFAECNGIIVIIYVRNDDNIAPMGPLCLWRNKPLSAIMIALVCKKWF